MANSEKDYKALIDYLLARSDKQEGRMDDHLWQSSRAHSMSRMNQQITDVRKASMRMDAEEPTVLIQGEAGTEKESVARAVHNYSRRSRQSFVMYSCSGQNEATLESDFFGDEAQGKPGLLELCHGGTLFVDEIHVLSPSLQERLKQSVQTKTTRRKGSAENRPSDVRLIGGTFQTEAAIQNSEFLRWVARSPLSIPSLRDRKEDVAQIARFFAHRCFQTRGKQFGGFTSEAEESLRQYPWPGNTQELFKIVELASIGGISGNRIDSKNLSIPQAVTRMAPSNIARFEVINGGGSTSNGTGATAGGATPSSVGGSYMEMKKQWISNFEREYLRGTLARHGGNVSAASREAKLDRSNFLRLLRRHGLKAAEYRPNKMAA